MPPRFSAGRMIDLRSNVGLRDLGHELRASCPGCDR